MSPVVSIVVACTGGAEILRRCLESLEAQRGDAEVIAVGAWDSSLRGRLSQRFPWVKPRATRGLGQRKESLLRWSLVVAAMPTR